MIRTSHQTTMSKTTYHLPRCTCGHLARYYRSTGTWKCCYCPATFTPKEAEALYDVPEVEEQTFDIDSPQFDMFKNPSRTITAPVSVAVAPVIPVAVAPVVTASPITAPLPVAVAPIEKHNDTVVVEEIYPSSHPEGEAFDVDELFRYHPKVEVKTSPQRMAMPVMAQAAQRAEAPTFDTGRNQYSLRSER